MAQQVVSVPNPNYAVTPLTTVAGSIVSRRRVKIPANLNATYTHAKGNLPSTITFDIADNESFVDLSKLVLSLDLKPGWPSNIPFPQFDGSVQSLIAKITIGSSQGLKIEEINNYSLLANMIQSVTETNLHKESTLLENSSYTNTRGPAFNDGISFLDSSCFKTPVSLNVSKTHRLTVRFHQSSFLNRVKMLPLFLFRNGLRIEIELEDFHRTFVYKNTYNVNDMVFIRGTNYQGVDAAANVTIYRSFYFADTIFTAALAPQALPNFTGSFHASWPGDKNIFNNAGIFMAQPEYERLYNSLRSMSNVDNQFANTTWIIPVYISGKLDSIDSDLNLLNVGIAYLSSTFSANDFRFVNSAANDLRIIYTQTQALQQPNRYYYIGFCPSVKEDVAAQHRIPFHDASFAGGTQFEHVNLYFDVKSAVVNIATTVNYQQNFQFCSTFGNFYRYCSNEAIFTDLLGGYRINTGYTITNPELVLDLVKPSADEFLKYTQAFQSPSGIPYNYKRIIYKHKQIDNPGASSFIQIPIDLAVRSLTGIIFTFQDPKTSIPSQDSHVFLSYPNLSSFLRRGLIRYEVIVGGQQYPLYPLYLKRQQDNTINNMENNQYVLELENFFAVNGTAGVIPSVSKHSLESMRNYGPVHGFQSLNTTPAAESALSYTLNTNHRKGKIIMDSASSIFALSLSKDDINNFAAGIDSSQSGSVILNLYFDDPYDAAVGYGQFNRSIKLNVFCFCDAVFTLQSDANLVRY